MFKLLKNLKPYSAWVALVLVLLAVQAVAGLFLPDLNADIINEGIAKNDIGYILRTGGLMLLITAGLAGCAVLASFFTSRTSASFGRDLRIKLFSKAHNFSQNEIDKFGAPSLITRNTNDVQQMQMVVQMGLGMMISAPITAVGGVIMALRQDVPLSLSIAVILPVMAIVIAVLLKTGLPLFKSMQGKIDRINQVMREKLSGIRIIRAFVREDFESQRFDEANKDLMTVGLRINRIMALAFPLFMLITNLSIVAVMWFGALRIDAGAMPIGNLTAFITYIMQILMSVMMSVMMFTMLPRAAASAERINAVFGTDPSIHDPENAQTPQRCGRVDFRGVEFRYAGAEEPVLSDISFSAMPGETTAIIGSTGCGKSTLINLIPRLYDVSAGSIMLDGADIREMTQDELRSRIGFIPQKAFLFTGTVAENMRYGNENATDAEIEHALRTAQGWDFVSEMPEGLESVLAQGGANLSGGQKQRLAIARALIKKPDVYIFDDSFSALDFRTDAALRVALKKETEGAAVLIVAQRVSTIMHAQKIIVLEEGRIAGIGTHAELMDSCSVYREIVLSQHSMEELA